MADRSMDDAASPTATSSHAWQPGPMLNDQVGLVVDYWMPAMPGQVHRGMPSPWLTLVISYDDPVAVEWGPEQGRFRAAHRTLVGGLHRHATLLPQEEVQNGVQLDVSPFAAPALFGVTAGEVSEQGVDLDARLGRRAGELADALADTAPGADRFRLIRSSLGRRLETASPTTASRPEVRHAWTRIVDTNGRLPVSVVAEEVGWSRRHLAERMRRTTGFTPKQLARTARFQHSRRLIMARVGSLADVAYRAGYADQRSEE